MKFICLGCGSTIELFEEDFCPVCGSEDYYEAPEEVDEFDGHYEGSFKTNSHGPEDRED